MSRRTKEQYKRMINGELNERAREAMRNDLKSEDSEISEFLCERDQDVVEHDLMNALGVAVPRGSRFVPPDNNESQALFAKIKAQTSIQDSLEAHKEAEKRPLWKRLQFPGLSFALGAATAAIFISVTPQLMPQMETGGAKGPLGVGSPQARIRLMFNVGRQETGRPLVIERGVPGGQYPSSADILLRFEIQQAGYVCLLQVQPNGQAVILGSDSSRVESGWHDLRKNGRVQAISQEGLTGKNNFFALYSEKPIQCLGAFATVRASSSSGDLLVDSFFIGVQP